MDNDVAVATAPLGYAKFRAEVEQFVLQHCPAPLRAAVEKGKKLGRAEWAEWQAILFRQGWGAPSWPVEHGGTGWDIRQRLIFDEMLAANDCPPQFPHGVHHIGPVLIKFGSEEQKRRFLPGILDGSDWWCQGYSEPGAGSDLASLKTRADGQGDVYVVNGQKVWTSHAHEADLMYTLVRTSTGDKKQQGITMLLIPLRSPGVEVRKIRTIEGWHHVNEVFLDNVEVPVANRVGDEGAGWSYGKYLLEQERINVANAAGLFRQLQKVQRLVAALPDAAQRSLADHALLSIEGELLAHREMGQRTIEAIAAGQPIGVLPSVLKVVSTRLAQRLSELALDATGEALAGRLAAEDGSGQNHPVEGVEWLENFLYLRSRTIVGGTTEVQKNMIARTLFGD